MGAPIAFRIGIGKRSLAKGEIELKPRGGAILPVKAEQAVERMLELLKLAGS